jgi:sterol desaturase/sphingolipid hydroxylase (fatty acid hydroxylase superfamily)
MAAHEFLTYVGIAFALMTALSLIELVLPLHRRARPGRVPGNLALSALVFVLNWGLVSATALIAVRRPPLPLPMAAQIVVSVVVLDLCTYIAHVTMHKVPFLWRFHRVHHSDPFVDATTTYRTHPFEGFWRYVWIFVPAWVLGLPALGIVVYRLTSALNAIFEHANVPLWKPLDRVLSLIWVTPNMHKVHHSNQRVETDSNYGNILSLFDRLFRTFTRSDRAYAVTYGLDDVDPEQVKSLPQLMTLPFQAARSSADRG